jgi:hypothetical protein
MLFRADFSEDDWAAIERAVRMWLAEYKAGDKRAYADVDPDYVMRALRHYDMHMVLVGGYLLVYDVGSPWYAPDRVTLEELTVFRVSETPRSFRVIPETLLRIAAAIPNCTGIVVGTSFTRDARLKRVYQRYGFAVEAEQLYRSL